jgi:hypothetical protein
MLRLAASSDGISAAVSAVLSSELGAQVYLDRLVLEEILSLEY